MIGRETYGRHQWQWAGKGLTGGAIVIETERDVEEARGAMSPKGMYGRHKWQ